MQSYMFLMFDVFTLYLSQCAKLNSATTASQMS